MPGAYVVEADLTLLEGCDPRAPGGAVTVELCGHWEHEGPCRWPHNSDIEPGSEPARFRTVYVADEDESTEIAARIEDALRADPRWQVTALRRRAVADAERELANRLVSGPRAAQGPGRAAPPPEGPPR